MAPDAGRGAVALEAVGIGVDYAAADAVVTAVDDVSLHIQHGMLVVIAGPSGSGKSSLLRTLGLLDRPTRGTVYLAGQDVTAMSERERRRLRRTRLAYVHQRPIANLVDDLSAREHVQFAGRVRGLAPLDPDGVLATFGLLDRAASRPAQLSGGEQQRLAVAVASAVHPLVLFADEPTAELDRMHADDVIDALVAVAASGQSVVVASHDPKLVAAASAVVRMREGRRIDD